MRLLSESLLVLYGTVWYGNIHFVRCGTVPYGTVPYVRTVPYLWHLGHGTNSPRIMISDYPGSGRYPSYPMYLICIVRVSSDLSSVFIWKSGSIRLSGYIRLSDGGTSGFIPISGVSVVEGTAIVGDLSVIRGTSGFIRSSRIARGNGGDGGRFGTHQCRPRSALYPPPG